MESCKKRSRKSKLVPRECLDSDDENIADMQNEIELTIAKMTSNSILKKLSRHTEEPLKFSIKVEVEEVDEPINTHIKQEETDRELNITIDSIVSLKEKNTENINLNSLLDKTPPPAIVSKGPEVLQCVLTEKVIRQEFNKISKQTTSQADKLIENYISNVLGRYSTEIELDGKEFQLQSVLGKWKNWLRSNPKHRDVPLSYKCYICSKAWWHYYDFRQHFHTHDQAELDIETCGQDCNVIAYENEQPDYDITIDEACWRCGHDFTVHRVCRSGKKTYKCKGCLEKFISCTVLNEHSGNCEIFKKVLEAGGVKTNEVFSCPICPVKYFSDEELEKHLKTRHSVRSDLPVVIHVKNCPTCNHRSIAGYSRSCKLCKRNFRKAPNFQKHQTAINKYHKCMICGMVLTAESMVLEHLLTHSNTYTMVYKCNLCLSFVYFLSEFMMKEHRLACHKRYNSDIHMNFFERIVVPKTLLEMRLLDFNEYDSKNDSVHENMIKSKKGKSNINMDKAITEDDTPSIDIDEVTTNIDEVSTSIDEVASTIEVPTDIDDASANIDIVLNTMEPINIKKEKPDIEEMLNNEYSKDIIIKQEPMEIDFNINDYDEDNINDLVVKEEIVEHVVKICDLNSDIKIEIKDEPIDGGDYDMVNDNDFVNDDKNDEDFRIYSCTKCPYKGIHRLYKEHLKLKCQNSSYTCTKCNSKHQSLKDYLCHFQQHNYVPYTCPKCLKQLPVIGKLTTHVYQHIKNNFVGVHFINKKTSNNCYQCRECRNNVTSNDFFMHWESHIEITNQGTGSEPIDSWEKKPILEDVIALLQGEIPDVSKELQLKQCVMCLKNFSRKNDLKRHLIEHLLKDAYINREKYGCLKCQICNIGFNKIDIYKRHMRDHGSLPLYKCEICDKTFSDSSNFTKHKKVHNLSVLLCDICKKKFTCKAYLIKHMEMHAKLQPIECDCCRRVFHSPSLYRKHRNPRYRSKCAVCSVTFNSLKEKWDHMWLEHKERKYLADCPICKKSFRKYQDVKMHIRTTHDSKYVYKPIYVKINRNEEF